MEPIFAKVDASTGRLFLYDEIGGFWGVPAKAYVEALDELEQSGAKSLEVFVNSPGGDVFEGMAILAAIKRWDGPKTVTVDGLAASIASVIALAGDTVRMAPGSMFMIHDPWGMVVGVSAELRKKADLLDQIGSSIRDIYVSKTKATEAEISGLMAAETWMDAEDAKARGFVDEIIGDDDELKSWSSDKIDAHVRALGKFNRAPAQAASLLARRRNPAAPCRVPPAVALAQPKEPQMDPVVPAPQPTPAPAAPDMLAAVKSLTEKVASLQADLAKPHSDPSAQLVADAAARANGEKPAAPHVSRFATPRAVIGREDRSDAQCRHEGERKGLPLVRAALALAYRNEIGARDASLSEMADMMGFRKTAERLDQFKNAGMSEGDNAAGGSFVPTDFQTGFIDSLEHLVAVRPLIPPSNIVRSSREQIQWPRITSGFSGAWVGEGQSGTAEALTTGSLSLRAHKMRVEALVTRDLLRDAQANVDQIIYGKLALKCAQLEDLAIVEGTGGSYKPRGLKSWADAALAAATSDVTYENARKDLRKLLKTLATSKIPAASGRAFVGAEIMKWGLGDLANAVGAYPLGLDLDNGHLMGVPAVFSTQLSTSGADACFYCFAPGDAVFFEQLAMLLENDSTYVDANGATQSASAADSTVIRLWRKIDFGMQHEEAVEYLSTCTWGA